MRDKIGSIFQDATSIASFLRGLALLFLWGFAALVWNLLPSETRIKALPILLALFTILSALLVQLMMRTAQMFETTGLSYEQACELNRLLLEQQDKWKKIFSGFLCSILLLLLMLLAHEAKLDSTPEPFIGVKEYITLIERILSLIFAFVAPRSMIRGYYAINGIRDLQESHADLRLHSLRLGELDSSPVTVTVENAFVEDKDYGSYVSRNENGTKY